MFERLIKANWKWTGKKHLILFFDGLINMGRPGTVFYPMERIEQGAELVLCGLDNTPATRSHPDWVRPWRLERQQDPDTRDLTPTGVNLQRANPTCRNGISFGLPESNRESIPDPVGMLTRHPFGWSLVPFVREGETSRLPRLLPKPFRKPASEIDPEDVAEPVICCGPATRLDDTIAPERKGLRPTWTPARKALRQPAPIHVHLPPEWIVEGGRGSTTPVGPGCLSTVRSP